MRRWAAAVEEVEAGGGVRGMSVISGWWEREGSWSGGVCGASVATVGEGGEGMGDVWAWVGCLDGGASAAAFGAASAAA